MKAILWLISLPFRLVGYAAVLGACVLGFLDLWRSVNQDRLILTPLGETWFNLSPDTLNISQAAIQRGVHPVLWDPVVATLLRLPGFLALLIVAAVVLLVAQLIYRPR